MLATARPRFLPQPCQDSDESGRILLRDGTTAHLRPATSEDRDALVRFFRDLSTESRSHRFLSPTMPGPDLIARMLSERDPRTALTLVVTRVVAGKPRIVGTGSYMSLGNGTAEVALAVADYLQGKGLGTLLLERLALVAVRNGFTRFWALTALDNGAMLNLFQESGFDVRHHPVRGGVEIDLTIVPTETSVERQQLRDRVATVASLLPLFQPNGVVVVGASREPTAVGRRTLDGLLHAGFHGPVFAVNPKATEVAGLRAYPSVRNLPSQVDLAVIAVPAAAVLGVVDDCAARGVRALVVLSAGFAEIGPAGVALQRALVEKVRGYGMRMVGPNCLGLLNTHPEVRLNASFSPVFPPTGQVAMSSQSGAIGLAALDVAGHAGPGLSTFVSVGNKADVSGNDLLQYWEEDPDTAVILLYLESFGNPRRFGRIARRVARRKPIVVLHSGLTRAGGRAAGSHTAALATNATAVEALFRQTGVIRAHSLEEMFDLALALECQPAPTGSRVAIITNAGGPGILAADACEAGGLSVPEPSPELRAKLAGLLPGAASLGNPLDLIAAAGPEEFRLAIECVLDCGEYDSLIVLFTPVGLAPTHAVTEAIAEEVEATRKAGVTNRPVLACVLSEDEHAAHLVCGNSRVPCYRFPEAPARVLTRVARYGAWRAEPPGNFPDFENFRLTDAKRVCRAAIAVKGECWLSVEETRTVLADAGLPLVPGELARTADEAVAAATQLGFPVAVKLASRTFVHKSEVNGVRLGLADGATVRQAFEEIRTRIEAVGGPEAMDGVLVQPMVSGGIEVMAGVTQDPLFGPLVAFGLGGIHVEVLADVCFRIAPLTDRDAAEMVRSIRGTRLLAGYRGHPPADLEAIEEVLLRLSRLAEEVPEIREIDLNPLFAFAPGARCKIADARIRVSPPRGGGS